MISDKDLWNCQFCGQKTCIGGHNADPFDFDYVCLNCSVGYFSCSEDKEPLKITIKIEQDNER